MTRDRRSSRGIAPLIAALCASLLIAPPASGVSTRAEYITIVDPLCREGDAQTRKAIRGYGKALGGDRYKRAAKILRRATDVFSDSVDEVAAVAPPAADATIIQQWLTLEREDIDVSDRMASSLAKSRIGKFNKLVNRSRGIERQIDQTIGSYGFAECN